MFDTFILQLKIVQRKVKNYHKNYKYVGDENDMQGFKLWLRRDYQ